MCTCSGGLYWSSSSSTSAGPRCLLSPLSSTSSLTALRCGGGRGGCRCWGWRFTGFPPLGISKITSLSTYQLDARSRSGSSARGTVTRGRPSPPAAVYPPVNRGVLAVPAIKLRILSSLRISFSCQLCILGLRSITPTTRLNLLKNKNKQTKITQTPF